MNNEVTEAYEKKDEKHVGIFKKESPQSNIKTHKKKKIKSYEETKQSQMLESYLNQKKTIMSQQKLSQRLMETLFVFAEGKRPLLLMFLPLLLAPGFPGILVQETERQDSITRFTIDLPRSYFIGHT